MRATDLAEKDNPQGHRANYKLTNLSNGKPEVSGPWTQQLSLKAGV